MRRATVPNIVSVIILRDVKYLYTNARNYVKNYRKNDRPRSFPDLLTFRRCTGDIIRRAAIPKSSGIGAKRVSRCPATFLRNLRVSDLQFHPPLFLSPRDPVVIPLPVRTSSLNQRGSEIEILYFMSRIPLAFLEHLGHPPS